MKIISTILALCLLLSALCLNTAATELPPLTGEEGFEEWIDIIPGDVNIDGVVNSIDSNVIKRFLVGAVFFNADQKIAADLNNDKSINSVDANYLKRKLSGS